MTQGPEVDGVVLTLTPSEAKMIAAALRQYEPYWSVDNDTSRQHLGTLSKEIMTLLARLRSVETAAKN